MLNTKIRTEFEDILNAQLEGFTAKEGDIKVHLALDELYEICEAAIDMLGEKLENGEIT